MANTKKISEYGALVTPDGSDLLEIVDVSDTSMAATGTNKKITLAELADAVVALASAQLLSTEGD